MARRGPARRSAASSAFQCYRADLDRERALKAAGELDTASDARFQTQLPFEPVNRARLDALKADRAARARRCGQGIGQYVDKRRHAQIAARHALQAIAAGLRRAQLDAAMQCEGDARCCGDPRRRTAAAGGVAAVRGVAMTRAIAAAVSAVHDRRQRSILSAPS